MRVTVIGMGKVGLPLAVVFAQCGLKVVGLEIDKSVVSEINQSRVPFPGEKNLDTLLNEVVKIGNLVATTDSETALSDANVIVVCIPLIVGSDNSPDFSNFDSLIEDISSHISPGTLICFETTLPIGTTRNRFTKSIESKSGLISGLDFFVVYSPERISTGRFFQDLRSYPKIVGGVTEKCTEHGVNFYKSVLEFEPRGDLAIPNGVWRMSSVEAAEFVKLAETVYRDVNIGLANDFALHASSLNLDITEIIHAANSQPYSNIHAPGISVGGHCIPIYPHFYLVGAPNSRLITEARKINSMMPVRAVKQIKTKFPSLHGLSIAILGLSYRTGVKEVAFSGAITLLKELEKEGATVYGFDPLFDRLDTERLGFKFVLDLNLMDGIIVHTYYTEFSEIDFESLERLKFFYDGRMNFRGLAKSGNFSYLSV